MLIPPISHMEARKKQSRSSSVFYHSAFLAEVEGGSLEGNKENYRVAEK